MMLKIYNLFLRIVNLLIYRKCRKKTIVFESLPDYSGSPKMICLELEKRGFRSKCRFVWAVNKGQMCSFRDYECIPFWGNLNFFERLKKNLIVWNAVLVVDSNRRVGKSNEKTFRFFARHGGNLKRCTKFIHMHGKIDALPSLSDEMLEIDYGEYKDACISDKNQIQVLGFPANDELFYDINLTPFWCRQVPDFSIAHFKKIIGWFPTFRQRCVDEGDDSSVLFPFGIPIVKTESALWELNELLKQKKVLLVIQIHHAQKRFFDIVNLSNIVVVDQKIKDEMGVTNANLMHCFDALITDYSAAYHEYLMLDRPLAVSVDDYEDYLKHVGFCFDFFDYIKGFYMKNFSDLKSFISEVAEGIDSTREERMKSLLKIHKYVDANSTQRVVDYICGRVSL